MKQLFHSSGGARGCPGPLAGPGRGAARCGVMRTLPSRCETVVSKLMFLFLGSVVVVCVTVLKLCAGRIEEDCKSSTSCPLSQLMDSTRPACGVQVRYAQDWYMICYLVVTAT